jgi:hypothetical protein
LGSAAVKALESLNGATQKQAIPTAKEMRKKWVRIFMLCKFMVRKPPLSRTRAAGPNLDLLPSLKVH